MTETSYEIIGQHRPGRWLITCDHASNRVPNWVNGGDLGLSTKDMQRHIAYDIGARGLALALAKALDSPVICGNFSRLVIDPNRGEDDPTLLMKLYDGTIIPANRSAGQTELRERLEKLYRPYHAAIATLADRQKDTVLLAVHSFTPKLQGREPRPWQIGILHSHVDSRLALPLIERLRQDKELCVGNNQPYLGHLPGDAVDRHALQSNRPNALIELRHDLIVQQCDQQAWGMRLAPVLQDVLATSGL